MYWFLLLTISFFICPLYASDSDDPFGDVFSAALAQVNSEIEEEGGEEWVTFQSNKGLQKFSSDRTVIDFGYRPVIKLCEKLPKNIYTLQHLTTLSITDSHLTGKIPDCIGELENLEKLNLFHNYFQGDLPTSLQNLKKLKHLNLARNGGLKGHLTLTSKALEHVSFYGTDIYKITIAPFNNKTHGTQEERGKLPTLTLVHNGHNEHKNLYLAHIYGYTMNTLHPNSTLFVYGGQIQSIEDLHKAVKLWHGVVRFICASDFLKEECYSDRDLQYKRIEDGKALEKLEIFYQSYSSYNYKVLTYQVTDLAKALQKLELENGEYTPDAHVLVKSSGNRNRT